jgi:CRP/FNR family transcriptional regulator, cyclic AMP receptor protein
MGKNIERGDGQNPTKLPIQGVMPRGRGGIYLEQKTTAFGSGQTLFRQGEKGGDLYFIKSGKIELSVRNEDTGKEAVLATLGERSVLGTMSFLEGEPRSATAKCVTDVQAIVISQGQRERLLKTIPSWFHVLVKDLSSTVRRLNSQYTDLKSENDKLQKRLNIKEKRDAEEQAAAMEEAAAQEEPPKKDSA